MSDDHELLTYAQAAQFLNVRLGTLYALVSRKEVPHVRLGKRLVRFSRRALSSMIADRSIAAARDSRDNQAGRSER